MEAKRLMKVTYQDLKKGIRLNAYADAVIWSEDPSPTLAGLRFGGYAEVVRGLTDAIYGGATIEIEDVDGSLLTLKSLSKQYHREVSHEGLYAEATLIAEDEIQESSKSQDEKSGKHAQKDDLFDDDVPQQDIPAHICYIFCHPGNEDELFQAIDQKSYVPMIPEYQDYVLAELKRRRILRPLRVRSLYQELEAWKLCCEAKDQNLVRVMEDGLKRGKIKIPGASPGPSLLDGVHSVTDYLNTFGVTVAERIKKLFVPLFDPATEPLSEEVLDINEYIRAHAGYSLYDAQLAVAEAIKRKLGQRKGSGDIICMLDESDSAEEAAPWCKAVALALLDIAMRDQLRFAMIHFSGKGHFKTDLFIPRQYDQEDVLRAAELFLSGGTNYETPLQEALRLMEESGFENADMVFITDGACELPSKFRERLSQEQAKRGFHITGVLLDQDSGAFEFSLAAFCDEIIRTSELTREQIAERLVSSRIA